MYIEILIIYIQGKYKTDNLKYLYGCIQDYSFLDRYSSSTWYTTHPMTLLANYMIYLLMGSCRLSL